MTFKAGYMQKRFDIEAIQQRANMNNKKVKWDTFFTSEQELTDTLKEIDLSKLSFLIANRCISGYEYIQSFAKQVHNGKQLSEAQLKQCKRLAIEIYKAKELMEYVI